MGNKIINSLLQKEKQHFNFSVYVDDVTISSNEYISKEIIKSIKNIFNKYKYKLNKSKLKIQKINLKPLVITGVSIQLDKVLPYKVKKGINYIRELNGLIKLISKYSDKKMNNKIRSTLILKTKKGGDLFRKYHGVYTYVKSAQNEIIKKTEKNRYFRAWLKSRKKFSKVNNLILKTSKMWGKKPEKLSKNEKYKLKSTIKKINEIKTWKIIRNKKTA